ncbi:threonine synthase [Filimonas lacunae]|uniref:Threonine synthase n=1 Tax=Filimonas lacunae TaxID=477680 RepID=A0A173MM33_9BACT|nr:threonine synthase [Filimonas lacunae]BAV08529.1 threonine synthase [Filimonas lacunae]SIT34085.1 threonine synthase [Filimonas lacunae]
MQYYSLNRKSPNVSFAEATVQGQAPDKGLYFPEHVPSLPANFINDIHQFSKEELGFTVMKPYVGDSIPDQELQRIVKETVDFPFPLVKVKEDVYSLELFHGPTLAFKDVGARFMSRCLGYFNRNNNKEVTVLVATSGDTGGAVANGFLGVEGVNVVILYPSGKVSPVQELQLTTCGQNITALEVKGNFDDCQAMVKQAFTDADLNKHLTLTSANSINVARWLPQQLYYFFAYQQWKDTQPPVISVPSGNFGNICAGIIAHVSGLPVQHFIAACNDNDVVPVYFASGGNYEPKPAVATLSNAMDVGNPSNFVRILELFNNEFPRLQQAISSYSISDDTTVATVKEVYTKLNYLLDPHGAVGYYALADYLKSHSNGKNKLKGFFLETAHPVKFPEAIEKVTGEKIPLPESVSYLLDKQKESVVMNASFNELKSWLLSR